MDKRSVRVALELADQRIDGRRGTSLFVFIGALLVAMAIGVVRAAPSLASPQSPSSLRRQPAVRKHDEQGDDADVLVLRDGRGDGNADDAHAKAHRGDCGGKRHHHGGQNVVQHHGGGTKAGTTHATAGGRTGSATQGATGAGKGDHQHRGGSGGTTKATAGGKTGQNTQPGNSGAGGGTTNATAGGRTGQNTRPTCGGGDGGGGDTAPQTAWRAD